MKNIVKNNEKMKELNVVKSEVSATLQDAEINSHATSDFELSFPLPENMGGKEVKLKINVTTNVTSSIAAQEKLDEIAENRKDRILDEFGKLISLMVEKIPEIGEMAREEKKKNRELFDQLDQDREDKEVSFNWNERFDLTLSILKDRGDLTPKEYIEKLDQAYKSDECVDMPYEMRQSIIWAVAQMEKHKLGLLNSIQVEMLTRIGLV